jgi:phosphate-selective porin
MKKSIFTVLSCLCLLSNVSAQEPTDKVMSEAVKKLQKLKISGYVQTQFQYGEKDASLKVGSGNEDKENSFNRIGIRRGRIKFACDEQLVSGVFQLDITEKGVGFKDAYLSIKDPWIGSIALKAGIFDRPFGYEISYSSSRRESPERSMVFQTLFPDERDLGGMLTLQAPETSPLNFLKLEAGLFAGNGIRQETDNRKDFIGHLSADKTVSRHLKIGAGVSYYNGGVYQGTENVYEMTRSGFERNSNASNKGTFAKREYIGFDAQLSWTSPLGLTQLRGEYLFGVQPGTESGSKSPNASSLPTNDTYIRSFGGGYAMLVQDLGNSPVSAVIKYDGYDPNTKVSGNEIGRNHTAKGDMAYNTLGLGLLWQANSNIRLQACYELVTNEKTEHLSDYSDNRKDNTFTLRLQYKF